MCGEIDLLNPPYLPAAVAPPVHCFAEVIWMQILGSILPKQPPKHQSGNQALNLL